MPHGGQKIQTAFTTCKKFRLGCFTSLRIEGDTTIYILLKTVYQHHEVFLHDSLAFSYSTQTVKSLVQLYTNKTLSFVTIFSASTVCAFL